MSRAARATRRAGVCALDARESSPFGGWHTDPVRRLLAVLVLLATLSTACASAGVRGGAPHASVRVVSTAPFTVRGSHFRPRERVRLAVSAVGTATRRVQAGPTGAFAAVIRSVRVDDCSGYAVRAVGSAGSRAAVKLPAGECAPPAPAP